MRGRDAQCFDSQVQLRIFEIRIEAIAHSALILLRQIAFMARCKTDRLSGLIRKSFEKGLFQVVVSEPILEELADVFNRPRIRESMMLHQRI